MSEPTELFAEVKELALNILQTDDSNNAIHIDTPLLGHLPEFDSMSVVAILTAIEDQYGVVIDDDEVSGDVFVTWRALTEFVQEKLDQ
jgi:acyl carrier protein